MAVGQAPPAAVEVDQPRLDRVARGRRARRAIAVPDTIDTSCSADGPPRTTATGVDGRVVAGRRRHGHQAPSCGRPAGPVAGELDLEREVDAVTGEDLAADVLGEPADVGRRPALVVDDEVSVLLRHDGAADPVTLEPELVDQAPGRVARRVAEHRARRRQAQRLVRLAPAADLVEPGADLVRVRRCERPRRRQHDLARVAVGQRGRVLEPAVAVGEAELGDRDLALGAVGQHDRRRLEHARRVAVVRAGVRPDRAAGRARDREPVLEPAEAGLLALGRGARHRDAGVGVEALAVDLRSPPPAPGRPARGSRRPRSRGRSRGRAGTAGSIARACTGRGRAARTGCGPPRTGRPARRRASS